MLLLKENSWPLTFCILIICACDQKIAQLACKIDNVVLIRFVMHVSGQDLPLCKCFTLLLIAGPVPVN